MAILKDGVVEPTFPNQFDKQIHSIEWFHNGEWKKLMDTVYPLNDAGVLDDTLDCGGFMFINEMTPYPNSEIEELIQLTPIRILWDSSDDFETEDKSSEFDKDLELQLRGKKPVANPMWRYRVVDEINFHKDGRLYKFTVKTLEPTKLLELETCDTMTFTNKLGRNNSNIKTDIVFETIVDTIVDKEDYEINYMPVDNKFISPLMVNSIISLPILKVRWMSGTNTTGQHIGIKVKRPNENFTEIGKYYYTKINDAAYNFTFSKSGKYEFRYYCLAINGEYYDNLDSHYISFVIEVKDIKDVPQKPYLTISNCFKRIVEFGKTRREDIDAQKFFIAEDVLKKYYNISAPEFHITRATMWEALKTIAGHIHCIPRLIWNEDSNAFNTIILDELGSNKQCNLKALHNNRPIAWDIKKNLNDYCNQIETYVDNLVNTRDCDQGSIVEPYGGGWISARASDGQIEVKDDTVRFKMSRPGYKITKLEIKYGGKEADITNYLFEAAEYETLSNFEGAYPFSTAYALKYSQGGKEISELAHCAEKNTKDILGTYKTEAIKNIAKQTKIGTIPSGDFINILYRITYSPLSSARILQRKSYLDNRNKILTRFYNVSANTIESEFLGEHLKGAIARIGNDIEHRTYQFERPKDVPCAGEILDGKYIVKVVTEITAIRLIKATLILTENYNQKNEHVAIDSNFRLYDVSEKQSVERHINYSENLVIGDEIKNVFDGDEEVIDKFNSMSSIQSVNVFRKVFTGSTNDEQITWAWFQGVSKWYPGLDEQILKRILLPCLSQSEGISLIFNFACKDNFAAGYQIGKKFDFILNKDITEHRVSQTLVPYGNVYGEFEKMEVCFGNKNGINANLKNELVKKLPEWTSNNKPIALLNTDKFYPILISKDSREQLNFTYQLHFISNRKRIVIGSSLGNNNPLVTNNKNRKAKCYMLDNSINAFSNYIDVSDGYLIENAQISLAIDEKKFKLHNMFNGSGSDKCSVVWIDESKSGKKAAKLIIGENILIKNGSYAKDIWFNFVANEERFVNQALPC